MTNFVGTQEFAAVNFIMPFLMVMGSVGFMLGTGGSALIAKTIGSGDRKKANELFSMNVYISFLCGIVLAVIGFFCVRPVASLLGAGGQMLESSVLYGKIILIAIPAYVLQFEFQCLFATAKKPKLGLWVTVAAGCTNIVLDLLFVAVFRWGLVGAAVAFLRTLVFQVVSVLIFPIFWELDGIWFSIVAAEVLSACVTATFFVVKRKQYGY